jgi:hypothetical protein
MKKKTAIIITCVAFVVGATVGFETSSFFWSRLMEFQTVTTSLSSVAEAYAPLKLLRSGKTEDAMNVLEVQLDSSMNNVELMSATLNRPDILTNYFVVNAKTMKSSINPAPRPN